MRNMYKCPQSIKARCFTALVRPSIEYACQVWDPHFKTDIENLEKIQKRAGRFATGNYLLESGNSKMNRNLLGWETLEERRQQIKLTTFQRARLKHLDIPTDHLDLKRRQSRHFDGPCYSRHHSNVDSRKFSFYPSVTTLWNSLPLNLKCCSDIDIFNKGIKQHNLTALKNKYSYTLAQSKATF